MNMERLRRSRRVPRPGDIFALRIAGAFMFGRVIRTDAKIGGFPNVTMIYIYKHRSETRTPPPILSPQDLLIPPKGTNFRPWSEGYFETIAHASLTPSDVLAQHCFFDPTRAPKGACRDDDGELIAMRVEPCGLFALSSFRTLDDAISKAIGIPLYEEPTSEAPLPDFGDREIVFVTIKLSDSSIGAPDERFDLHALEDRIAADVEQLRIGELEGHEVGEGYYRLSIRATDARRIQSHLVKMLREAKTPPGSCVDRWSSRGPKRVVL